MNHMKAIQLEIQPIILMDQKAHIEDIGSHEAQLKLDGPYLNHKDNALNDDLKLPQGPITTSRAKKFKEALQGFMRNIWDNQAYEDPIHFEGLNGSLIEVKWALFNILEVQILSE